MARVNESGSAFQQLITLKRSATLDAFAAVVSRTDSTEFCIGHASSATLGSIDQVLDETDYSRRFTWSSSEAEEEQMEPEPEAKADDAVPPPPAQQVHVAPEMPRCSEGEEEEEEEDEEDRAPAQVFFVLPRGGSSPAALAGDRSRRPSTSFKAMATMASEPQVRRPGAVRSMLGAVVSVGRRYSTVFRRSSSRVSPHAAAPRSAWNEDEMVGVVPMN